MLLARTLASRASNIHLLDIPFMWLSEKKLVFNFAKLPKTWKNGRIPSKSAIFAIEKGTDLCVIQTLKAYHTDHKNGEMKNTQLLLGINKSHRPVLVSTVLRWIKDVICLVGIDVSLFKSHSIRSASISRARLSGASIQEILGESRWSNESTWEKFYKKSLLKRTSKTEYFVIGTPRLKKRIIPEFCTYLILLGLEVLSISSDWDFMK